MFFRRTFSFLLVSVLCCATLCAQQDTTSSDEGFYGFRPGEYCQVFLDQTMGVGYALYRDPGVSPLTYEGLGITSGFDVDVLLRKWRISAIQLVDGGLYFNNRDDDVLSFGAAISAKEKVLHEFYHHDHWQVWAGLSLDLAFSGKYHPSLENAALGMTNYLMPSLHGLVEFYTHPRPSGTYWLFHGALAVSPVARYMRPGYAYIDNYPAGTLSETLFSNYHYFNCLFPKVETNFGAEYVLRNGNRVGLAYRWSFLTTGGNDYFRFEEASHLLVVNLKVLL